MGPYSRGRWALIDTGFAGGRAMYLVGSIPYPFDVYQHRIVWLRAYWFWLRLFFPLRTLGGLGGSGFESPRGWCLFEVGMKGAGSSLQRRDVAPLHATRRCRKKRWVQDYNEVH